MGMKLVVAIVQNDDADDLIDSLTAADYRATRLASTGGFLRQGNTTIILGVPEQSVDAVLSIIEYHCHSRRAAVPNPFPTPSTISLEQIAGSADTGNQKSGKMEIQTGRATVFVLNLERYERT